MYSGLRVALVIVAMLGLLTVPAQPPALFGLIGAPPAGAAVIDTVAWNGNRYYLISENTATGAELEAQSLGGHLATIESQQEHDFLWGTWGGSLGTGLGLWIGLTDQGSEGDFVWMDGKPVTFTNWASSTFAPYFEPNNGRGLYEENFVTMDVRKFGGQWNDVPDAGPGWLPARGIVEVEAAVFLLLDEDSIDNGNPPNLFSDVEVNDHIAEIGVRSQLSFFAAHFGQVITLHTGRVGDEGWFALKTIPAEWDAAGPFVGAGLRNYLEAGPGLGSPNAHGDPEALLDKVPNVTPLRAAGLEMLVGRQVCAVVYDGDISINYGPLTGSLKGATLGTVAFKVLSVTPLVGGSSSSLPQVDIEILDAAEVCEGPLELFVEAPEPDSSAVPIADAGPDQTAAAGPSCLASVILDGTRSADLDSDSLTFAWTGSFGTAGDPTPTVSLPTGMHTITLTVGDDRGGTASDSVVVTVSDTTPPALGALPGPITVEQSGPAGTSLTEVNLATPAATDNCGSVVVSSDAPAVFPAGTTTVTFTARDAARNAAIATTTVTVVDSTPPTISPTISSAPNAAGWNNTDATVSFSCSDGGSGLAACSSPVTVTAGGTTTVTGTASDIAGNSALTSVVVKIDKTPPTVTYSGR